MNRFARDVAIAVPAVFVACILWNVALDMPLLWACWKQRS